MNLGRLETVSDAEDALKILAKVLARQEKYEAASRAVATLASIKIKAKQLELEGVNVEGEPGQHVTVTVHDFKGRYLEAEKLQKWFEEYAAALEGQIKAMGGTPGKPPEKPPDRWANPKAKSSNGPGAPLETKLN